MMISTGQLSSVLQRLLNALEIQRKKIDKVKFVVNGAGAAAMACVQLYEALGAKASNFIMFDRSGVIHADRKDLDETKKRFAITKNPKLDAFGSNERC